MPWSSHCKSRIMRPRSMTASQGDRAAVHEQARRRRCDQSTDEVMGREPRSTWESGKAKKRAEIHQDRYPRRGAAPVEDGSLLLLQPSRSAVNHATPPVVASRARATSGAAAQPPRPVLMPKAASSDRSHMTIFPLATLQIS